MAEDKKEELAVSKDNDIKISEEVVSVIAGKAVTDVKGVASMSGGIAGDLSAVFSGKKNYSKGIKVDVGEKETIIDVNIIVEYGIRIPDVAFEIQNKVKKAVESMTGLNVSEVNVHVQGVNTEAPVKEKKETKKEPKKETKKTPAKKTAAKKETKPAAKKTTTKKATPKKK